jgi:uncharacterized membrane protein YeiH
MEQILLYIDYAGVIVFAITGCLVAAKKRLDIISFILLAMATGIGGGTLRDITLGHLPVFWIAQPMYLLACVVTACIMFLFARHVASFERWIIWGDAIGISVFTVLGTKIALETGAHWSVCITMGVFSSVVGGIIRDVLSGEPSLIMRREIYASACAAGAVTYLLIHPYDAYWAKGFGILATFLIRAAAIKWRMHLPGYAWDDCDTPHRRTKD